MNSIKKYNSLFIILLFLAGCNKFDDINTDPNRPITSTAAMQAVGQLTDMLYKGGAKYYVYDTFVSKQMAWGERQEEYQFNRFGRSSMSVDTSLMNCDKMVLLADEIDKDAYTGLALFIKTHQFFRQSLEVGDIPYKEALQGEEGIRNPRYDTQKDVMKYILEDLDEAYACFSRANREFEGDIVYGGNLENWKKTVTALQLKVLISLSKKEGDSDLNIKEKFAQLVSQRPLYSSNSDNFQMVYTSKASQTSPLHITKNVHTPYAMISSLMVDSLKKYNDYRLFYYGKPSSVQLEEGWTQQDWEAYPGVDPTASFNISGANYASGDFTGLNNRYTQLEESEPLVMLGYAEQNFILAEACLRGWISGDPNVYYKRAIEAGFRFTADNTPDETDFHHGRKITDEYIDSYLENPDIQLMNTSSSFESDLNKIITQRYMGSFIQYPWDSYYEYRRTGYPVFPVNPETNLNTNPNKMPMRWMYEQREYDFNRENVEEAVARQFNGNDDVNELMWILK